MSQITCKDVVLSYDGNTVLSDLSFTVEEGNYLCIVGENGSGKSTLVRALLGLKGLTQGSIIFGDGLRQNGIGYLPQQTLLQKDFPSSVQEVVLSGCLNSHGLISFYTKKDKETAALNMKRLGISDLKKCSYRELSGGQQQRVLLARALCSAKKLILLDEPAAGLDPVVTAELYSLIKSINDSGITVIMVTHDVNNAVKYSSHILHLQNRPLFFGETADYLKSEASHHLTGGDDHAERSY